MNTAKRGPRDEAIARHEHTRRVLIDVAETYARDLAKTNGGVTAPEVLAAMRRTGWEDDMRGLDPRWVGAVFRRAGWCAISTVPQGSHGRRVPVWKREASDAR